MVQICIVRCLHSVRWWCVARSCDAVPVRKWNCTPQVGICVCTPQRSCSGTGIWQYKLRENTERWLPTSEVAWLNRAWVSLMPQLLPAPGAAVRTVLLLLMRSLPWPPGGQGVRACARGSAPGRRQRGGIQA